jgi:hypothetical protein
MFTLLLIVIGIALLFDLVNGFHDAANSIATVVSTKVLTPFQAVVWAAAFNVLAFWVFDMSVGNTVAKTVDNSVIDLWVILAGLLAATAWNLFTSKLIPEQKKPKRTLDQPKSSSGIIFYWSKLISVNTYRVYMIQRVLKERLR